MKYPIWRTTVAFGVAATLAACADGTLPPRAASDPANPGAPESPAAATATPAPPMPSSAPGLEHSESHGHQGAARSAPSSSAATVYACPMHPDVTSATPGTCPKCGMKLEPKVTGSP